MNAIKYFKNKNNCPLCKSPLTHDKKSNYEIYCSCCGLVLRDFEMATSEQLDIIFYLKDVYNL